MLEIGDPHLSSVYKALQGAPSLAAYTRVEMPVKFRPWFEPRRYKIAHGGRCGAKSTTIALMLLLLGMAAPLSILCAREVQKSIDQSVYRLLKGLIEKYGLQGHYRVLRDRIVGANGTEFLFRGLSNETIDSVRSLEGIDICWIEEAAVVRERSWRLLIPTIRKPGSEIWISYNPELDNDYVHKHITKSGRSDMLVTEIGIIDNPWASEEMWAEFVHDKQQDEVMWAHTWMGRCLPAVQGAIYAKQMAALEADNRLCRVPYNPSAPVLLAVDIGFSDYTSLILGHHVGLERQIFHAFEDHLQETSYYIDYLKQRKWRIDVIELPHDAYAKRINAGQGKTVYDEFRKAFPNASIKTAEQAHATAVPLLDGIQHARKMMANTYIDKDNCTCLVESLRRYRWHINQHDQQTTPVHDQYSHTADGFRYWHLHDNIGLRAKKQIDTTHRDRALRRPL